MTKRISTACPEHDDCVLRVTTGDGPDKVEHSSELARAEAAEAAAAYREVETQLQKMAATTVSDVGVLKGVVEEHGATLAKLAVRVSGVETTLGSGLESELAELRKATADFARIASRLEAEVSNFEDVTSEKVTALKKQADDSARDLAAAAASRVRLEAASHEMHGRILDHERQVAEKFKELEG